MIIRVIIRKARGEPSFGSVGIDVQEEHRVCRDEAPVHTGTPLPAQPRQLFCGAVRHSRVGVAVHDEVCAFFQEGFHFISASGAKAICERLGDMK